MEFICNSLAPICHDSNRMPVGPHIRRGCRRHYDRVCKHAPLPGSSLLRHTRPDYRTHPPATISPAVIADSPGFTPPRINYTSRAAGRWCQMKVCKQHPPRQPLPGSSLLRHTRPECRKDRRFPRIHTTARINYTSRARTFLES